MKVEEAIKEVCLAKEPFLVKLLSAYPSKRNFFEMMRFDFVVDEELNVFIMEVTFYAFITILMTVFVMGFGATHQHFNSLGSFAFFNFWPQINLRLNM